MGDSPRLFEAYERVCKSLDPVHVAKLFPIDVPTRWNSTYDMIDVVLASTIPLDDLLLLIHLGHKGYTDLSHDAQVALSITPQVWDHDGKFHEFLGPIADATALIPGSEYPTLGAVVAIYKIVCFHVDGSVRDAETKLRELGQDEVEAPVEMSSSGSSDETRSVQTDPQLAAKIIAWKRAVAFFKGVQSKLVEYRGHVLSREANIAGGLDPRFKSFAEDDTQQLIIDAFNAEYRERFDSTRRGRDPGIMSPSTKYPKLLQIVHDMSGASRRRRVRHSIQEEIEDWFTNPSLVVDLNSRDVCDWFCANQDGFPRIAFVAREYQLHLYRVKSHFRELAQPWTTAAVAYLMIQCDPSWSSSRILGFSIPTTRNGECLCMPKWRHSALQTRTWVCDWREVVRLFFIAFSYLALSVIALLGPASRLETP